MRYFLLMLMTGCASYHPRGTVISRLSQTEGLMKVESSEVRPGDKLVLKREVCRFGVRGYLDCRNIDLGEAEVEERMQDQATFKTAPATDFKKNDLLERTGL